MLTEKLVVGAKETNLGSVSAGVARSFSRTAADGEAPIFRGTAPFPSDSKYAALIGYQSPSWSILSFGLEYFGGTTEVSATSLALFVSPRDWFFVAAGAWFTNDREFPYRAEGPFLLAGFEVPLIKKAN